MTMTAALCSFYYLGFLGGHAGAIQAICAMLGLAGLAWYCFLTHGIHQASLKQAAAAIRPFIVIDELKEADYPGFRTTLLPISEKKIFIIRNLGSGPAMDITWALGSDAGSRDGTVWISLGDLAVCDYSFIFHDTESAPFLFVRPLEGMVFRFSDSADSLFETTEVIKNGRFHQKCRTRTQQ